MTNHEAIRSLAVGYPVDENTFLRILTDRGLAADGEYTGKSKAFDLSQADLYVVLLTAANITEGGFQVSITDKTNFMKVASALYDKWGEPNPLKQKSNVQGVSPW